MAAPDPTRLPPRQRAERIAEIARGGVSDDALRTLRLIRDVLGLTATRLMDWPSPDLLWQTLRRLTDHMLTRWREEREFAFGMNLGARARMEQRAEALEEFIGCDTGLFSGVSAQDVGGVAARIVWCFQPELFGVVPPEYREPIEAREAAHVTIEVEERAPPPPKVEFRPGAPPVIGRAFRVGELPLAAPEEPEEDPALLRLLADALEHFHGALEFHYVPIRREFVELWRPTVLQGQWDKYNARLVNGEYVVDWDHPTRMVSNLPEDAVRVEVPLERFAPTPPPMPTPPPPPPRPLVTESQTFATLEALLDAAKRVGADRYLETDAFLTLYRPSREKPGSIEAVGALKTATGFLVNLDEWHVILGALPVSARVIGALSPPVIEARERGPTQPKPPETGARQGEAGGLGGVGLPSVGPPAPPPSPLAPPRKTKLEEGPQRRLMVEFEIPLTEKYRPRFLEDLVGNPAIVQQLQFMARTGSAPPCIVFVGPPGVGKTTAARALARTYFRDLAERQGVDEDLFGPQTFFEVGTEDIRIDPAQFVEGRLVPFLRSLSLFGGTARKWVLLDDVQKLSPQTQQSLLRPIEKYSKVNTVIFAVNDARNLAPALRSRCEEGWFEFRPIEPKDIARRLREVAANEGIVLDNLEAAIDRIAKESKGDVRVALGLLAREWRAYQARRS